MKKFFIALFFSMSMHAMNIWEISKTGSGDFLEQLLLDDAIRARIDEESRWGWTPLMYAATNDNVDTMQVLLNHGSEINKQGASNVTALSLAIAHDKEKAVRFLLANGADTHLAHIEATINRRWKILKVLLAHNNDVSGRNKKGDTIVHFLSLVASFEPEGEEKECIDQIVSNPTVQVDAPDHEGITPLMRAARRPSAYLMRKLLNKRASYTQKDKEGHDTWWHIQDAEEKSEKRWESLEKNKHLKECQYPDGTPIVERSKKPDYSEVKNIIMYDVRTESQMKQDMQDACWPL